MRGYPLAHSVLGFCYEFGLGVEVDFVQAEQLYLEGAQLRDGLSQARLAFLRKYGRPGVKINRVEADRWQDLVARVNPHDSLGWLMDAAVNYSEPSAQYALGVCYHDGVGVEKDEQTAVYWYKLSAAQGHARGQGILGFCYGEGFGVDKDEYEAMRWYRLAAEQGESVAIYNVGYCYEEGIGVEKNELEAVKWYRLSANQGNAFAQNSLGYCYEDAIGVEKDTQAAVKWYRKSAD